MTRHKQNQLNLIECNQPSIFLIVVSFVPIGATSFFCSLESLRIRESSRAHKTRSRKERTEVPSLVYTLEAARARPSCSVHSVRS